MYIQIYKWCTQLSEQFVEEINPVMRRMGYCCGQKLAFTPLVQFCYGNAKNNTCVIARDQPYYMHDSSSTKFGVTMSEKYIYCLKCFEALPEEGINANENSQDPPQYAKIPQSFFGYSSNILPFCSAVAIMFLTKKLIIFLKKITHFLHSKIDHLNIFHSWIPKSLFQRMKNDQIDVEPEERCHVCDRKWHKICALHNSKINGGEFICELCRAEKSRPKPENKFTAKSREKKLFFHIFFLH